MSTLINKVLFTRAGYGLTVLRIFVGVIFAAHGAQKLFGMFGGYGLAGTAQYMESLGLAPGQLMAILAGGTEFFGGLALIIGLLVRPAALGLTFGVEKVAQHVDRQTVRLAVFERHENHLVATGRLAIP